MKKTKTTTMKKTISEYKIEYTLIDNYQGEIFEAGDSKRFEIIQAESGKKAIQVFKQLIADAFEDDRLSHYYLDIINITKL